MQECISIIGDKAINSKHKDLVEEHQAAQKNNERKLGK
jgi:hypothetical protein